MEKDFCLVDFKTGRYNIRKINPDATAVIINDDSTTEFQGIPRNVPKHIGGADVLLKYPSMI